ncbi:MAG TPA: CPBP family intramembrane glutamic endopeptidase [Chlamydiales bacterium]|nr:CPBP family intramembrane glutamic endopeptidase [Chlamydiales bacterium]
MNDFLSNTVYLFGSIGMAGYLRSTESLPTWKSFVPSIQTIAKLILGASLRILVHPIQRKIQPSIARMLSIKDSYVINPFSREFLETYNEKLPFEKLKIDEILSSSYPIKEYIEQLNSLYEKSDERLLLIFRDLKNQENPLLLRNFLKTVNLRDADIDILLSATQPEQEFCKHLACIAPRLTVAKFKSQYLRSNLSIKNFFPSGRWYQSIIVAPIAEECMFRELIPRALSDNFPHLMTFDKTDTFALNLFASSALFGVIHMPNALLEEEFSARMATSQSVNAFFIGIFAGAIRYLTPLDLPGAIGFHFSNNIIAGSTLLQTVLHSS